MWGDPPIRRDPPPHAHAPPTGTAGACNTQNSRGCCVTCTHMKLLLIYKPGDVTLYYIEVRSVLVALLLGVPLVCIYIYIHIHIYIIYKKYRQLLLGGKWSHFIKISDQNFVSILFLNILINAKPFRSFVIVFVLIMLPIYDQFFLDF